jgi:hypothetical protein
MGPSSEDGVKLVALTADVVPEALVVKLIFALSGYLRQFLSKKFPCLLEKRSQLSYEVR